MFVNNSICGYRESKKTDKYIVELATRAHDPDIQALAVDMLNEYHKEVQAAQDDPDNLQLMQLLLEERAQKIKAREAREREAAGAKAVPEKASLDVLDANNIVTATRARRKPERFEDVKWSDEGHRIGVLSEQERLELEALIGDDDDEDNIDDDDDDDAENYFSRARLDPWLEESDSDVQVNSESDYSDSIAFDSDLDEAELEARERPLTEKQRARHEAREAKRAQPKMDEGTRQLANKLLDEYERVYTIDDLDEDKHLARALRLIHSKKVGLPFDEVSNVHIKVRR